MLCAINKALRHLLIFFKLLIDWSTFYLQMHYFNTILIYVLQTWTLLSFASLVVQALPSSPEHAIASLSTNPIKSSNHVSGIHDISIRSSSYSISPRASYSRMMPECGPDEYFIASFCAYETLKFGKTENDIKKYCVACRNRARLFEPYRYRPGRCKESEFCDERYMKEWQLNGRQTRAF